MIHSLLYFVFHYAGMEIEQPHEGEYVCHQDDQLDDDQDVPYGVNQPVEEHVPYQYD